jgi:hypothetical protein
MVPPIDAGNKTTMPTAGSHQMGSRRGYNDRELDELRTYHMDEMGLLSNDTDIRRVNKNFFRAAPDYDSTN